MITPKPWRTLLSLALLMGVVSQSTAVDFINSTEEYTYTDPLKFKGRILLIDDKNNFWIQSIDGFSDAEKKRISSAYSRSNYRLDSSVVRVGLYGLDTEFVYDNTTKIGSLIPELLSTIKSLPSISLVYVSCFSETKKMPICQLMNSNGDILEWLISKGLSDFKEPQDAETSTKLSNSYHDMVKEARMNAVGAWRPFYSLGKAPPQ